VPARLRERYCGVIRSDVGERRLVVAIPAQRDRVRESVIGRVAVDVVDFERHVRAPALVSAEHEQVAVED
jgi:hypothetical protein